jgi:hypothetical protein
MWNRNGARLEANILREQLSTLRGNKMKDSSWIKTLPIRIYVSQQGMPPWTWNVDPFDESVPADRLYVDSVVARLETGKLVSITRSGNAWESS